MQVTIRVRDVNEHNRYEKFEKAYEALEKALQVKRTNSTDASEKPLPIVEDIEHVIIQDWSEGVLLMLQEIIRAISMHKARAEKVFRLPSSKIVTSLATGKPLTMSEWNKITKAIDDYLKAKGMSVAQRAVAMQSSAAALIRRLEKQGYYNTESVRLEDNADEIKESLPELPQVSAAAQNKGTKEIFATRVVTNLHRTGEYIQSLNDKVRSDIKHVLIEAIASKKPARQIAQELFDKEGTWNRDWRRIAQTESRNAYNDAHIMETIAVANEMTPGQKVYMIGKSSANACKICIRDISEKVVLVLPEPPAGDHDYVQDVYTDTAIWPGKTAVGHSAKEHYAVITRHPHCGCRWVPWFPKS